MIGKFAGMLTVCAFLIWISLVCIKWREKKLYNCGYNPCLFDGGDRRPIFTYAREELRVSQCATFWLHETSGKTSPSNSLRWLAVAVCGPSRVMSHESGILSQLQPWKSCRKIHMKIQKYPFTLEMSKDKFIKFRYNMMQQRNKTIWIHFEYNQRHLLTTPPRVWVSLISSFTGPPPASVERFGHTKDSQVGVMLSGSILESTK